MKKILALAILPLVGMILLAFQSPQDFELKESILLQAVMTHLKRMHFSPVEVDDLYSESVFDEYIERLDPNKRLLLASEINQLNQYRNQIDDEVKNSTFDFFDSSVKIIDEADKRAEQIYNELIESDFDHNKSESVETDQEKTMHCDSEDELRERWRKILKLQILRDIKNRQDKQEEEKFEGEIKDFNTIAKEAKDRLDERMDRWFNQRLKSRRVDRLSAYVNSITTFHDPHTNYLKPKDKEDFDMRLSNRLEGIGARLTQDGDYVKVVDVIPGGPAWKEGSLEVDDVIVKVAQEDGLPVDVVGWHINDVIGLIRGKKGTHVRLIVKKVDNREVEIPITRDIIVFDEGYVRSYILEHEAYQDKIGYIMLPSFYFDSGRLGAPESADDVKIELEKLEKEGVEGIILDLRNNGGGSLLEVVEMSGFFIESGPIVQVKSRGADANVLSDTDRSVLYDGALVVLVNQGSASASEILAAAMQDYGRAVIVGSRTFGKGTVQRFYDLDRSIRGNPEVKPLGELKITTQKFFRIDGGATQLKGVMPDIEIPGPYQHFSRGERDYDHAMIWSEIEQANYGQQVYEVENLEELVKRSHERIENNPTFQRVNEYAHILKKNEDRTIYPLSYQKFYDVEESIDEEMEVYKKLYPKLESLNIENIAADLEVIQGDSTKIERNNRFLKSLSKDVELEEATAVIHDMIHLKQ